MTVEAMNALISRRMKVAEKYGDAPLPPATKEDIKACRIAMIQAGLHPDDEYFAMLELTNGFSDDGYQFLATHSYLFEGTERMDIIAFNEIMSEDYIGSQRTIYAQCGDEFLVYLHTSSSKKTDIFAVIDIPSGDSIDEFDSFSEMVVSHFARQGYE